jgi:CHAT domain-containing protein
LDKDTWLADIYNTGDWLWVTLIGPLIERLNPTSKGVLSGDQERPSRQRELPHIIFVPTGLIGLLPLHLAFRIEDGKQRTILDDFIISYTPSAHSLGTARSRAAEGERQYPRLLALVNPSGNLPSSLIEAQLIASHFPDGMAQIIEGKQATQEALVNALPGQTYLHFACHGRYDPIDVLHSSLMLAQDNPLELREILEPGFNLASTRLVTLSACETGLIEISKIPDECVGLPAGFLQAGAPAVVSTLWAVNDLSTSLLMGEFYRRHLVEGEAIAEALCGAQLWLRDSTAGELRLAEYFEQLSNSSRPPDPEAFSSMRYYQKHPDDKPFNAPYYWAPFILTGW